jgi:hypothetical protein
MALPRYRPAILQAATPHRVTLLRAGRTVDGYGDVTLDYVHGTVTKSGVRAYVQATATQQILTTGLDQVVQQWRVFLPPEIDIAAWDRLLWQGHTFTFDGAPQLLQRQGSPLGFVIRLNDQEVSPGAQGVH